VDYAALPAGPGRQCCAAVAPGRQVKTFPPLAAYPQLASARRSLGSALDFGHFWGQIVFIFFYFDRAVLGLPTGVEGLRPTVGVPCCAGHFE